MQPERRSASRFRRRPRPNGRRAADHHRYPSRPGLPFRSGIRAGGPVARSGHASFISFRPRWRRGGSRRVRIAWASESMLSDPVCDGHHAGHRPGALCSTGLAFSARQDRGRPRPPIDPRDVRQRPHSGVQRRAGDRTLDLSGPRSETGAGNHRDRRRVQGSNVGDRRARLRQGSARAS